MPSVKVMVYFTKETFDQLHKYKTEKYGRRNVLSIIIEEAVKEYLEKEETKSP